ncbi:MAG: zinc ribbon domain-containing protein [Thermoproteales archaeon]|nr:zinc ribbon domain-containing protein [Thermoproteales archaeon]
MDSSVICPYCGARNPSNAMYCGQCGKRITGIQQSYVRDSQVNISQISSSGSSLGTTPTIIPPGIQERLTPATLFYIFKDEFKEELDMDGVWGMVAATIYTMLSDGVISIYPSKRGRILKKDTLVIAKQRMFNPRTYGFLSLKISNLPYGYTINVYDIVYDSSKKNKLNDPEGYISDAVLQYDLNEVTWNFLFKEEVRKVKLSLLDKLLRIPDTYYTRYLNIEHANYYRPQAEKLKQLLRYYRYYNQWEMKVIKDECNRALYEMKYYESDY